MGYLLYRLYKLLRGSIAFNIVLGIGMMLVVWQLVRLLGMDMLNQILTVLVNVGIIALIIIFQPEIRRFLLILGNVLIRRREGWLQRFIGRTTGTEEVNTYEREIQELKAALLRMGRSKIGALVVLAKEVDVNTIATSGTLIDGTITQSLVESIFSKESPLHDGAMIIRRGRVFSAAAILPVSENPNLPRTAGLRHRAAVGITERTNVAALIVSEETGAVSYSFEGVLHRDISENRLDVALRRHFV